jgi:hypothetical protein
MDEGSGLECLAGFFLGHLLGRQPAEFVIDERQKLIGSLRVALLDGVQHLCDINHNRSVYRP